jgi:hypothetical protein
MADNKERKCAHEMCECRVTDDKYCSEYCEDAVKAKVLEIGCGCEHDPCHI